MEKTMGLGSAGEPIRKCDRENPDSRRRLIKPS